METIADRIQLLLDEKNEKATHVLESLELSKNALSEWKRGKAKPSSEAIIKLARHFNVTTDYILTGTKDDNLSDEKSKLLQMYSSLSDENKKITFKIITALKANENN